MAANPQASDRNVTRLDDSETCVGQGSGQIRGIMMAGVANLRSHGPIYGGVEGKASRFPRSNLGQ